MAYEHNNIHSTWYTVNGGGLDTSSHMVEVQTTMAEDVNTVLGESFNNNLMNFDATYHFGHGES